MGAKGAAAGGDRTAAGSSAGDTETIAREGEAPQVRSDLSPMQAWGYAECLGVLCDTTTKASDVAGLGDGWIVSLNFWRELAPQFKYCILAATSRGRLNRPSALLAKDSDALCHAAALLSARVAPNIILWANVASVHTWTILADSLIESMPTEGRA